ncbi:unnamed protein product, partial [Mesorhabditis spiculigera]
MTDDHFTENGYAEEEEEAHGEGAHENGDPYAPPVVEEAEVKFTVIGQETFQKSKPIRHELSWLKTAKKFQSSLAPDNLAPLETIKNLPEKLAQVCAKLLPSWFPVQAIVLPNLLDELRMPSLSRPSDVAIAAPTGSGKTLCYVLPCLAAAGTKPNGIPTAVIVLPVQQLVHQSEKEFLRYNAYGATIFSMSGSDDLLSERKSYLGTRKQRRLVNHLLDSTFGKLDLTKLRFLICDEADRMGNFFHLEWLDTLERAIHGASGIGRALSLSHVLKSRSFPRKILLSATLSRDVEYLNLWNLYCPQFFTASSSHVENITPAMNTEMVASVSLPDTLTHEVCCGFLKYHPLLVYQKLVENDWKRVLIFTNRKDSSNRLAHVLSTMAGSSFVVEQLTADLFGNRRKKVLNRFIKGQTRVLVSSDVLSRGIDIPEIEAVVNYDLPTDIRLFLHRSGRTARAGSSGVVLSIIESKQLRDFEFFLTKNGLRDHKVATFADAGFEENKERIAAYRNALGSLKEKYILHKKYCVRAIDFRPTLNIYYNERIRHPHIGRNKTVSSLASCGLGGFCEEMAKRFNSRTGDLCAYMPELQSYVCCCQQDYCNHELGISADIFRDVLTWEHHGLTDNHCEPLDRMVDGALQFDVETSNETVCEYMSRCCTIQFFHENGDKKAAIRRCLRPDMVSQLKSLSWDLRGARRTVVHCMQDMRLALPTGFYDRYHYDVGKPYGGYTPVVPYRPVAAASQKDESWTYTEKLAASSEQRREIRVRAAIVCVVLIVLGTTFAARQYRDANEDEADFARRMENIFDYYTCMGGAAPGSAAEPTRDDPVDLPPSASSVRPAAATPGSK